MFVHDYDTAMEKERLHMNKNNKNTKNTNFNCCDQSKQRVDGSWVNGSNGSVFWMGHIWVMGRCTFTHDPPAYLRTTF